MHTHASLVGDDGAVTADNMSWKILKGSLSSSSSSGFDYVLVLVHLSESSPAPLTSESECLVSFVCLSPCVNGHIDDKDRRHPAALSLMDSEMSNGQ